jgi:hypothetical protein
MNTLSTMFVAGDGSSWGRTTRSLPEPGTN